MIDSEFNLFEIQIELHFGILSEIPLNLVKLGFTNAQKDLVDPCFSIMAISES
jgi:hypothetical protein